MADSYRIGPKLAGKLGDVVRIVESLPTRGGEPPTRLHTAQSERPDPYPIRIGTFDTAAWSIGTDNTVTLTNVGVTGYTVLATNIFAEIGTAVSTRACAVAKDGTQWYLIQAECTP